MAYWLFKSEPDVFSIDDLAARPKQTEPWNGVRNYQARNSLRDAVKVNDLVFFYHSSCVPPGIVGIMKVVKAGYADATDANNSSANPIWYCVDVQFVKKFPRMITLDEIKQNKRLQSMVITRKGNRLSITPVTDAEWHEVLALTQS